MAPLTPAQRSAAARKANASRTPAERSAASRKAWETIRAKNGSGAPRAYEVPITEVSNLRTYELPDGRHMRLAQVRITGGWRVVGYETNVGGHVTWTDVRDGQPDVLAAAEQDVLDCMAAWERD